MTEIPARLPAFLWYCVRPNKSFALAVVGTVFLCALLRNMAGPYFFERIIDRGTAMQGHAGMQQAIALPALIFLG